MLPLSFAEIPLLKLDSLKKPDTKEYCILCTNIIQKTAIQDFTMLQNYFLLTISNAPQMTSNTTQKNNLFIHVYETAKRRHASTEKKNPEHWGPQVIKVQGTSL